MSMGSDTIILEYLLEMVLPRLNYFNLNTGINIDSCMTLRFLGLVNGVLRLKFPGIPLSSVF